MKAFLTGLVIAIGIAVVAGVVSNVIDFRSSDVYQSHSGSVRLSAQ